MSKDDEYEQTIDKYFKDLQEAGFNKVQKAQFNDMLLRLPDQPTITIVELIEKYKNFLTNEELIKLRELTKTNENENM